MHASYRVGLPTIALLVLAQTGCLAPLSLFGGGRSNAGYDTSLLKAQGYSLPPGGMPRPLPESMPRDPSSVIIEVRGDQPKMAAVPLPADRAITVEEFARQLDLPAELGHCQLCIMRPNGTNPPVRLDVKLDGKGRPVSTATNYALRPGDHIIALSDGRTLFERFLDKQLGRD